MPASRTFVVDASVAVKWFLPEHDADRAASLFSTGHRLIAPDLLWIEAASVLWKLARRGTLSADETKRMIADAAAFPVETIESFGLLQDALHIATTANRSVYHSLYVALAARESATVVTADERLSNALSNTSGRPRSHGSPTCDGTHRGFSGMPLAASCSPTAS